MVFNFVSFIYFMLYIQRTVAIGEDVILLSVFKEGNLPGNLTQIQGDLDTRLTSFLSTSSKSSTFLNPNLRILSIACNQGNDTSFIYEISTRSIYRLEQTSGSNIRHFRLHHGISFVEGQITYDWLNKNLYWTDSDFQWIILHPAYALENTMYKVVVDRNLAKPYGITVDSYKGFLFWSDIGTNPVIERSSLAGHNRQSIITKSLIFPNNLIADEATESLFWTDRTRETIERSSYTGGSRRILYRINASKITSLAMYKDILCFYEDQRRSIFCQRKTSGDSTLYKSGFQETTWALALYESKNRSVPKSPCKSKYCEHICVAAVGGVAECICRQDFSLNPDGRTCTQSNMNQQEFKLNQHVMLNGARGKIVDIYRPMGTYPMFKVQLFTDGTFHNVAKYQLVKSLPDTLIGNFPATESENENPSTDSVSINCRSTAATTISIEPISSSSIESIATTSMSNNPVSSRFIEINDDQYQQFRKSTENRQTKRKTDSHLNLLLKYLAEKGETREIFDIPPFELDYHLSRFIVCVCQKGGNEYEPTTLRGIIGSIERHLKDIKYGYSITQSNEFHETRTSLKSKQKDLRSKGKGNRPMQSDTITDQDIDTLYEMGQLGPHNPSSMINTLWFFNTLQFGIRAGGQEHRRIRWGDINLKFDDELDTEYLEYNERQTKTRTGENVTNIREQCPRIYAFEDNWDRCPVECFKAYSDKRPHGYSAPEDPFYIAPVTNTKNPAESERWFLRQPIGPNKLETLMKRMAEKADLPSLKTKKITNTSVRKYLCQKLLNNNIPDTHAIHITGHKNTDSLNNYRRISNKQQHDISTLLSNTTGHTTGSGSYNNNNNLHISRPAAIVSKSHTTSTNNVHGVATAGNVTMPVLSPRNLHLDPPNDQMTSSVFCKSVIQGGSFTININYNTKKIHPRRPQVIHSSDSEIMSKMNHDEECILNVTGAAITHIDTDANYSLIFYSDSTKREIFIHNRLNRSTSSLISTSVVSGMAYDWLDKKLFWTEADTGYLKIVSLSTRSSSTVFSGLSSPRTLTIDPYRRTLYWVEKNASGDEIQSGKTNGTQKQTIISGFYSINPNGLYFNTLTNRLYWETSGSLRSLRWNGSDIQYHFSVGTTKHLSIYKGYVIWTTNKPDIRSSRLSYNYTEFKKSLSSFGSITGMVIFDPAIQRSGKGSCEDANGGCQHICVASQSGRTCQCSLGFTLSSDETTCSSTPIYDDFLMTVDRTHNKIYQISLVDKNVTALDLPNLNSAYRVVYNFKTAMVIWSEFKTGQIRQSLLTGKNASIICSLGFYFAESLAIDFSTSNIYFSQLSCIGLSGSIRVVRDGITPKTIVPSLNDQFGIATAIYPSKGYLFFTQAEGSQITRCNMDGSSKTILVSVSTKTKWPNGLALDYDADRLYWIDGYHDKIESIDLHGGDRREILEYEDSYLYSVVLGGSYLYYTAILRPSITKLNKNTNQQESWMENAEFGKLYSLDIYNGRTHPVNSLCSLHNGQCSTYCLPTVSGRTCACEDGVFLKSDKRTCQGVTQCPSSIPNGFLDFNCLRYVGLSCDYQCSSTYRKNDSIQAITCRNNGSWNMPLQYLCRPIKCPTDIPNAFLQHCAASVGSICNFGCKEGFDKNDVSPITCLSSGQWSGNSSALCSRIVCHTEIPNGFFIGNCNGSSNTNCQYDCAKGYNKNPLYSFASCLSNGVWNPATPQLCTSEDETAPPIAVVAASGGGSVGVIVIIAIVVVAIYIRRRKKNEPDLGMLEDQNSDFVLRNRPDSGDLFADIASVNIQRDSTYNIPYDDPNNVANIENAVDIFAATSSDNLTIYAEIADVNIQRDITYDKPFGDRKHVANHEHADDIPTATSRTNLTDSDYLHPL